MEVDQAVSLIFQLILDPPSMFEFQLSTYIILDLILRVRMVLETRSCEKFSVAIVVL